MFKNYTILLLIALLPLTNIAQKSYILRDTVDNTPIQLKTVIIKATKDNSKVKDLPSSVTILPNSTIELNEIKVLNDITSMTPNLVMPDYGSKLTSPIYIRGIGSRINSPSVALYVDNVPYFEKAAFEFDLFDVERIEILRGPQGTLFGRNSMGGLINVITKSPLHYQGSHISYSIGNYGTYQLNAGHYNRLNDKLAVSFAANYRHNDGFYENKFLSENVDELDSYGFNNKIIYKFTNRFIAENIFSFENSNQGGYPYAIFNDSLNKIEDVNYNQYSSYDRKIVNEALKLSYEGEKFELTNSFSFQKLDGLQKIDQDFTPESLYFIIQDQEQKLFSDEIIFKSKLKKNYEWLFGGFAFIQDFDTDLEANIYQKNMWYMKTYKPTTKGVAFFHQSTFHITERLSLIGGIRYDTEKSTMHYQFNGKMNDHDLPVTDTIYPDLTDNVFLPKIGLLYNGNRLSYYASYSTGYKPGGFNSTFEAPEQLMFKNEDSYNYEVGMKGGLLNDAIYFDFALFYTKLENQQIYRTVPSGRGAYLDNAGLSENKGFEISLNTKSFNNFRGMISYGFTHSEILEYEKDSLTNYNNNYTPYIPKHTLSIQLNKAFYLNHFSLLDLIDVNLNYNLKGEQYWDLNNNFKEESVGLLNSKISFRKNNLQLDIWGKNILNEEYKAFLFEALGNVYAQEGKPFQFGANLLIKF